MEKRRVCEESLEVTDILTCGIIKGQKKGR